VNNALTCGGDIEFQWKEQEQYGLHPGHLHAWEHRLEQDQQTLRYIQSKKFTTIVQFKEYNEERLNQTLKWIQEHTQFSDRAYQECVKKKDMLLTITGTYNTIHIPSELQRLDKVRQGIDMSYKNLYRRDTLKTAFTPKKTRQAQRHLGLTPKEFENILTSGRYLPIESTRAQAYHFAWKGSNGQIIMRRICLYKRETIGTVDIIAGKLHDSAILALSGAKKKVVQLTPSDRRYQCHGFTFTQADVQLSVDDVQDILKARFQLVQDWKKAKPGDVVVYTHPDYGLTHTGVVVFNKGEGKVIIISKLNVIGGLYMHDPYDLEKAFGSPSLYTTDHPAGRHLLPDDHTSDLSNLARQARRGYL
jgi:hypothetical protein